MQNELLMAIVTGLWYWFAASLAGYTLFSTLKSPTFIGFVLGLIWGDPVTGVIAGGSIEVIYLGLVAAGGNIPSDKSLAALIAVPLVLISNMSVELAVSIALPVGIIGVLINNVRRYGNAFLVHKADSYAEEGNTRGIWHAATTYSFIFGFIIRFPIVFTANYFGADLINYMLTVIPDWFLHGMEVMGGLLPAIGFATTIFMIGKREFFPLFFVGYFLVQFSGISTIGAAIFGLSVALIITYMGGFPSLNDDGDDNGNTKSNTNKGTSRKRRSNKEAVASMMKETN